MHGIGLGRDAIQTAEPEQPDHDPTRGLIGAFAGFAAVLAVEALVFAGLEFVFEFQMRPVDVGWLFPPMIAGCVGWVVFRKADLAGIVAAVRARVKPDVDPALKQ
ncbi:MAG: hypothetical protein ACLPKB_34300 [Xanthobacteraceae bacterium]